MMIRKCSMWFGSVTIGMALSCCDPVAGALAKTSDDAHDRRRHGFRFSVLGEPPPAYSKAAVGKAHGDPPDAPFFFWDDALHTGDSLGSNLDMAIGERLAIDVQEGASWHFSGVLSSDGPSREALVKLGAGTLQLSGSNTYNGQTVLLQGILHVDGNRALSHRTLNANVGTSIRYSPGVAIDNTIQLQEIDIAAEMPPGSYGVVAPSDHADSVQWIVESGEAAHWGSLQGSAPLVKQGRGRLRIGGDAMAYLGAATVKQGTLAVDEFFSGSVQVNGGARLQGIGTVGPTVIRAGGTLAPGNSIGQLNVQGNLEFKPGARFEVDVAASGMADRVHVSGKARLDGDVVALAQAGDWQAATRYAIVDAAGGLDATRFASVSANFAFLTPSLSYDDTHVYLTLGRNDTAIADVTEEPTEREIADAIDGEPGPVYDRLVVLDRERAGQALRQLSGDWDASVHSGLLDDSRFVRQAVFEHASTNFWGHSFYSFSDRVAQQGVAADQRSINGLILGASHAINARWSLGGFFGAQRSHARRADAMADARTSGTHAGLNLAGHWQGLKLALGAAHTWHSIQSQRRLDIGQLQDRLGGAYRGRTLQVFGEVSRPFSLTSKAARSHEFPSTSLEPFIRLAAVRLNTQGFVEQGGVAALKSLPTRRDVVFSSLGLRFAHNVHTGLGHARIYGEWAWHHATGAVRSLTRHTFRDSATQTVFSSAGQPVARDAWSLKLGVTASLAKNVQLGLAYAGRYGLGRQDHGARVNLAWMF
ncbi:MAG: autotransporter domain-containing protein [Burkholderiaceae bacterium]